MPLSKKYFLNTALLTTALLLFATSALARPPEHPADGTKIGFVDVQKALHIIPAGKRVKAKLEKTVRKHQKALDKKQNDLKKMMEDLQKKQSMMTDSSKRLKQREYQQRMLALQDEYVKLQTDLKKKEAKLLKPVLKKLDKVIQGVAKDKGFSIILEYNQMRIIYGLPALDITALVIKRYGK